ncbi:MAG: hypothetical protein AAGA83_08615 [Cyanobacteria bacterium P01_F01_bin.116]
MTTASLVKTTNTSAFSPASPDPAGITYVNTSSSLLLADSEVNETPLFTGDNLFKTTLSGNLIETDSTVSFSNEPTGITFNPTNGHYFIVDDDRDRLFELNSQFQVVNEVDTRLFNSFDPEGVTYVESSGTLFIADGLGAEVYHVTTDGVLISSFDTASLGFIDPEGIAHNSINDHLYLVGGGNNSVAEITTSGTLVQTIDISAANPVKPAGLTFAPGSSNPNETALYIVDRGVDNNADPTENDGKIYEFSIGLAGPGNQPPVVNAGSNQSLTTLTVTLDGTVSDDGSPTPPGAITSVWSQLSGPGTATFGNANDEDTTVTFSDFGTYTLQLEASDGEFSTNDQIQITVSDPTLSDFIYVSTKTNGTVGGVAYADEDILLYDSGTDAWSLFFDGSDVGLGGGSIDVQAFHINTDGSILLSLNKDTTVPDVGLVDDSDILRFVPTATGSNTAGTFELYFDGSDVGLTTSGEDIDAIGFTPDDRLVISTKGSSSVDNFSTKDEDLLVFNDTSLGENTSGTWELYFDGSDVGLSDASGEDVNATWIDTNGDIYLSTVGAYDALGVSGDGADIFSFAPNSLGTNTNGNFNPFFDGSVNGLSSQVIDGFTIA